MDAEGLNSSSGRVVAMSRIESRQKSAVWAFVNLTYFVLIRARALTTSCGFCQASRQGSSNTFAYSPDDGG